MAELAEEVIPAARKKLLASPFFSPLIGTDVGVDIAGQGAFTDGWVFKSNDDTNGPYRSVENTGKAAVVISMRLPWGSPNRHNTAQFKQLEFTVYADQTRDTDNELSAKYDAEYRFYRVARAIAKEFHDAGNVDHWWPGSVYIGSCVLYNDARIEDVAGKDGLVTGTLSFALELD